MLCHCQHHCLFAVGRHVRVTDDSALKNVHLATRQVTSSVCCGRQGCSVRTWNVPDGQSASDPRMQDRVRQRRCAVQTHHRRNCLEAASASEPFPCGRSGSPNQAISSRPYSLHRLGSVAIHELLLHSGTQDCQC